MTINSRGQKWRTYSWSWHLSWSCTCNGLSGGIHPNFIDQSVCLCCPAKKILHHKKRKAQPSHSFQPVLYIRTFTHMLIFFAYSWTKQCVSNSPVNADDDCLHSCLGTGSVCHLLCPASVLASLEQHHAWSADIMADESAPSKYEAQFVCGNWSPASGFINNCFFWFPWSPFLQLFFCGFLVHQQDMRAIWAHAAHPYTAVRRFSSIWAISASSACAVWAEPGTRCSKMSQISYSASRWLAGEGWGGGESSEIRYGRVWNVKLSSISSPHFNYMYRHSSVHCFSCWRLLSSSS